MLTLTGSNSASALASTPARYIIGDERDRWATSAGTEGRPVGTGRSTSGHILQRQGGRGLHPDHQGQQQHRNEFLPRHAGTLVPPLPRVRGVQRDRVRQYPLRPGGQEDPRKKSWSLKSGVSWSCPACGCLIPEDVMRKQPAKWIADNPDSLQEGASVLFWLNAFSSPWTPWEKIVLKFLDAKDDPQRLKVVYNTPARPTVGRSRRPRGRGHHARPP